MKVEGERTKVAVSGNFEAELRTLAWVLGEISVSLSPQARPLSENWQTHLFISPATGLTLDSAFRFLRACAQCLEKLVLGTAI